MTGGKCTIRIFMICIPQQTLFRRNLLSSVKPTHNAVSFIHLIMLFV